jgi:hypothetical protein
MALNFPSSPVLGQVFTSGTRSWRFDGTGWRAPYPSVLTYVNGEPVWVIDSP